MFKLSKKNIENVHGGIKCICLHEDGRRTKLDMIDGGFKDIVDGCRGMCCGAYTNTINYELVELGIFPCQ